jgi:transposase InsO family protein
LTIRASSSASTASTWGDSRAPWDGDHLATSYAWAELHVTPLNPSAAKTSALARRVAADLAAHGWRLERVLSDNGSEFRSSESGQAVTALGARQSFIRAGRPATNGAVERVQRTILEECWRPSFARSLVPKLHGLTRDLVAYLRFSNEERAHTGRLTNGRTPLQALLGARKMSPR